MPDIKGNNKKIYDFLSSQGVQGIGGDSDQFQSFMEKDDNRRKVYDYLSSVKAQGIGDSYDAFSSMVYAAPDTNKNSQWAVTPSPYWAGSAKQEQQATAPAEPAPAPTPEPTPAPAPAKQEIAPEPVQEENPFPYGGGLEEEAEELRAQLEEASQGDADFVKEYEERRAALDAMTKDLRNLKGDIRNTGIDLEKFKADGAWLKENAERYEQAKVDKARVDEINGRLSELQKPELRKKNEEARQERKERMRGQSENNSIRMGSGGFASYPKDMSMVDVGNSFAADQLDSMTDQELDKGSKFDAGYSGNAADKIGTAITQFVAGGVNNVDLGSLTAGLSEYSAFKTVRNVADKNNGLINDAFKSLGYDDAAAGKVISDAEAAWGKLQSAYEQLDPMVAELKDMEATLEALANAGDVDKYTAAYNKYKKKYDEYAKLLDEYRPLQESVDKYTELMDAVQEAVASGLSDSERDVLDSFARYIEAKGLSAATESTASKAGAGAEQSLEFMLDFIITRGLGKTGTKAASKIASWGLLNRKLGETGAKIVGRGLADIGTSAVRTSLMFPRNLAAYGEQITSMDREGSGVDEFGRYTFDRTKANAALNTALSQYIEYWSEGFGEYFGAAEQALFKNATKLAPKTAIGQTLKNYRGSIGKYLDYGKFDGMFNEMLEEVVGSTFNALNGWVSSKIDPNGPGVGDKEALKEFVAGDNLATLFFSFLPMSAIGAATNMKAYHQMKERYDKSVGILNPFIEDGSIKREDLEDLTSRTAELSPEQIMDKFKEISRKAAEAQEKKGKVLPKNFDQALAGYLEGSFSMNLQREAWEDSRKIFAVASAYTAQYENPDARSAWDLAQEEQAARAAALAAGFTEEDLDKDSAILARESAELEETEPERSNILYNYSIAKGQSNGLKDGYDNQTRGVNERNAQFVRSNIDTNGQVIQATLNGNTPVYITQTDATVNPDGTVSTPTGDGVVTYVDENGNKGSAKASAFSNVVSTATGEYIESKSADYSAKRQAAFEAAQNTVSAAGQAREISEKVGHSIIVRDGNGVYQPVMAERMTTGEDGGPAVVISGDKKALQGIAEAMKMRVPTSGYLEAPVSRLYPLLSKEEDGSLSSGLGEKPQEQAAAPAAEAPAAEQTADLGDLRDQTVQISIGDRVQDAHVISTDDGKVMFELLDENGDVTRTASLPEAEFSRAMQAAAEPAPAAEAPAAVEETPVSETPVSTIPVDEKGEKMYSAPGVEVADAIADLYATEGLTEADVDQYIADEAAKAEAARNPERGDMSPQAWGQAKQEAARVADFWAAMQRAAEQRKAQQEEAIEEAVEEATPVETTEAQPAPESKQRIAPAATPMAVDSRRKVVARLKNWARRTGVKVNIIRSVDEVKDATAKQALKEGRALTGWFNDKTGEVDIFLPNVMNAVEADKTFIHETVAHKGLRGLLGEEGYNELCDRVWNELMTPEEQAEFMEYNRHLQGSDEFLRRAAADEYIARLSENMDMQDNRNIFEKIVDWIMDRLGLGGNVSGIEEGAAEKATREGSITRSDLYDLLEDSLKRFEQGRKKLNTESLPAEIQNEMQDKGLVMDGGVVMDEQQDELKKATGYQTPNELDTESSPEVGYVRFSESTMPAWARNYMTYRDAKKHVVQVLENFVRDVAADELVHGMVPTGVYKYGEKSSGSFAGPLRTNIEYIVTFDMDTSCPRSLQYLEYVKQIEAQIGRPLTQVESIQLIEMMRMYGQMIPCVYCYCENKRQALKQYYTDFMKARHGVINAKTEEEALAAMYGHNTTAEAQESNDPAVVLTPAAYEVFKKWRQEKDYNPTIEQLWYQYRNDRNVILTVLDNMLASGAVATDMSDKKITNALCKDLGITGTEAKGAVNDIVSEWKWDCIEDRKHNDFTRIEDEDDLVLDNRTLTLWREMTSYGKSASGAKNVLRYVPYTDELKTLSQEQRDFINGLGGLRMHSSNDFRIDYVLDYFQFMADMAVNKMFGHTYTKSPEFVRIFGNSGYKINMSVAAYEDSRGIRPNADEGFDWTTARELREQFPNAGVMMMATSDAQIQFALDNDWIDMCIPFHHSGLPKAVWYQMRHWSDYTSTQNEKFLNATEMRAALKADGVPVSGKLSAEAVEKLYNDHFHIKVLRGKDGKRMRPHFLPGPTPKDGVIIPGHNNDYETYMRLCREYGVHPRFYGIKVKDNTPEGGGREVDITEHPGYMKFIKETARTDSPQTAIEFNFDQPSEALGGRSPIEYALEELKARAQSESEMAGGPVRNIYESYKQDPYGIVPQYINGILKHKEKLGVAELPLDYLTPDSRKWFMTERRALEDAYKDFDTIPYHPHEYDENGNLIMEGEPGPVEPTDEGGTHFREVTDQAKIDELEAEEKVPVYRSMQFVPDPNGDVKYDLGDGNGEQAGFLYAPMSAKVDGKWRNPIRLGRWEEAEERPDLADENGEFILDKGDGSGPMPVAYAPYLHTRRSPLNEQFSSAYNRPNLVIVKSEIPKSELESNYTAEKSKKSTGEHDWPSGKVSNYLAKKGKDTRKVILSRWAKPVEIVPIEQVADEITKLIGDENVSFPYNVVTPGLRAALAKRGVRFNGWQGNKPKNVDELIAGMKAENESAANTRFREANRNQLGFVSNADAALDRIKMDKATPEQWVKMLEKEGGMKAGEDKWLGLSDWLKSQDRKSITKDEIADYIDQHRIQIEEVQYADAAEAVARKYPNWNTAFELHEHFDGSPTFYISNAQEAVKIYNSQHPGEEIEPAFFDELTEGQESVIEKWADEEAFDRGDARGINSTRLSYTTPGLNNNREIALTVPTVEPWNESDQIHFGDAGEGRAVAWARFGETKDGNGDRVLVIDEIQSKRHQEGREKGYNQPTVYKDATVGEYHKTSYGEEADIIGPNGNKIGTMTKAYGGYYAMNNDGSNVTSTRDTEQEALQAMDNAFSGNSIPAAPFEKNWHELAMKRMLRLAAEEGYDYVAWTTGDQQAERYNIGNVLNRIEAGVWTTDKGANDGRQYGEDSKSLILYTKDGAAFSIDVNRDGKVLMSDLSEYKGKALSEVVGKELADWILSEEGVIGYDTKDLHIGGEGMRGFYDDILPRFMNKYGKKWGVKVSDLELPEIYDEIGHPVKMHAVPVTQEMKESVMQGQTMFRDLNADREYTRKINELSERFDSEIDNIEGLQPDHIFKIGDPSGALLYAEVEELPIEMPLSTLNKKRSSDYSSQHPFDTEDIKGLVKAVQAPIAVFDSEEQNGKKVILTELKDKNGKNFIAILDLWRPKGRDTIQVNDIISLYPKESAGRIAKWFDSEFAKLTKKGEKPLLGWASTKKAPEWLTDHASDVRVVGLSPRRIANIINSFKDHQVFEKNNLVDIESGETLFREGNPAEERIANAERQATDITLDRMGEELGVKINRVARDGMPAGHKTDKGYYDPSTGEMTICMDNVTDERDAIATVLHETVGHKGLRDLFGDRFREAMTNIYASLDREGREWVNAYITRHNLGFGQDGIIRGMEEYMSHLAESGNYKTSVWERIKEILGKIVDLVFGTNGFVFTDRELNYILRASYEHLKNPNWLDTTLGKAQDALMKRELGINESDPNKPTDPDGPRTGILFREGDTGVASTDYDADMKLWHNAAIMENQNGDLPVKLGMERILKELYGDQWEEKMKQLPDDEDYLTRHNLASSRAETEAHNFELFHFTPLLEQVREIQSRLMGNKKGKEDRELAYERIIDYMYAVSALERNAWKNAQVDPSEQRDWSGITSLMGRPKEEWQEAEADAQAMIDAFRAEIGDDAVLDELWNRIRSCTDFSLEHAYKYGLLTREEYERLHGTSSRPRMWNYYLPLRGFAEDTAEDVFDYASYMGSSDGSAKTLEKAKGRWTEADNPLAYILRIAEAEIVQGNDNWAKQALYRFTVNAEGNSLLTQTEPWYVKDPSTGKWMIAEPLDVDPNTGRPETLEDFEARMQALRASDPTAAKKGRRGLKLDQIMVNKGNRNQHMIRLKVGGVDKRIWVNGDPSLAKAVNGWSRSKSMQWLRRAGRALSNLFTTYSIDFTAKNLIRDTIYSRVGLAMKEDAAYRHRFGKNWWSNFGYGAFAFPMVRLAAQWESGELQSKPAAARTEKEQMFIDFMTDGGQTGYTIINSINEIKKSLERSMRRAGKDVGKVRIPILGHYAQFVKTLNEGFELLTRFTAYQTSRQMGRSGQRSASDAKEISVNFNRRGAQSGEGIWGNIASYLGATHYFYNAGVQGFDNFLRLFKAAPVKMSATTVGLAMMGILTPMINSMLAGALAGAGGDGDDDWYWNVPEWVRRNNIIIGLGNWYLAVPLPVEFRAAYGLGDIAGAAFCYQKTPNRTFGGVAGDMLATSANILPVNPIEGYSGSGNLGDAIIRGVFPDAGVFLVDWATNRDYTGRALWKENPFNDTVPKSQGAFASTPKGIIWACQGLAQISGGKIDVAPGLVRDFMNNYGGGFFRAAEDVSKIMTGLIGNDPDRPFRWDNIPFFSGFTGHIDQDRSNSFAQGALREYQDVSEGNVKALNAICNTDELTAAKVYGDPEDIPEEYRARVNTWKTLHPKQYELGKMYRDGMNNQYKMKQYERGEKKGQWYKSKEIEQKGVNTLKKEWKDLRELWLSMPDNTPEEKSAKAEMSLQVQEAWHLYYNAEADLADKLMDFEYGK